MIRSDFLACRLVLTDFGRKSSTSIGLVSTPVPYIHRVFGIVVTQIPARRQHQPGPQSLGFLLEFLLRHSWALFTLYTQKSPFCDSQDTTFCRYRQEKAAMIITAARLLTLFLFIAVGRLLASCTSRAPVGLSAGRASTLAWR